MKIELTEADVLKGEASIAVECRDGSTVQAHCKSLSWAASLKVSAGDPSDNVVLIVLSGVAKEQANDEFLNRLTPESLVLIASVVMQLTNGLPALKKAQAARSRSAQSVLPTTTQPPANCASTDSVVASVMDSAPRS